MAKHSRIAREDVLKAFAIDFELGSGVLVRYLADYPQFSADLVDLSRELSREVDEDLPLDAVELAAVTAKMSRLQEATAGLAALQSAPPRLFSDAAKVLGLPLQVGAAIRERRVDVATLPSRVLELMAQALHAPAAALRAFLLMPAQVSPLKANKSSGKPAPAEKVPMERLLRDAGMDEERISALLHSDE